MARVMYSDRNWKPKGPSKPKPSSSPSTSKPSPSRSSGGGSKSSKPKPSSKSQEELLRAAEKAVLVKPGEDVQKAKSRYETFRKLVLDQPETKRRSRKTLSKQRQLLIEGAEAAQARPGETQEDVQKRIEEFSKRVGKEPETKRIEQRVDLTGGAQKEVQLKATKEPLDKDDFYKPEEQPQSMLYTPSDLTPPKKSIWKDWDKQSAVLKAREPYDPEEAAKRGIWGKIGYGFRKKIWEPLTDRETTFDKSEKFKELAYGTPEELTKEKAIIDEETKKVETEIKKIQEEADRNYQAKVLADPEVQREIELSNMLASKKVDEDPLIQETIQDYQDQKLTKNKALEIVEERQKEIEAKENEGLIQKIDEIGQRKYLDEFQEEQRIKIKRVNLDFEKTLQDRFEKETTKPSIEPSALTQIVFGKTLPSFGLREEKRGRQEAKEKLKELIGSAEDKPIETTFTMLRAGQISPEYREETEKILETAEKVDDPKVKKALEDLYIFRRGQEAVVRTPTEILQRGIASPVEIALLPTPPGVMFVKTAAFSLGAVEGAKAIEKLTRDKESKEFAKGTKTGKDIREAVSVGFREEPAEMGKIRRFFYSLPVGSLFAKDDKAFERSIRETFRGQGYEGKQLEKAVELAKRERIAALIGESVGLLAAEVGGELTGRLLTSKTGKLTSLVKTGKPGLAFIEGAKRIAPPGFIEAGVSELTTQQARLQPFSLKKATEEGLVGAAVAGTIGGFIVGAKAAKEGTRLRKIGKGVEIGSYFADPPEYFGDKIANFLQAGRKGVGSPVITKTVKGTVLETTPLDGDVDARVRTAAPSATTTTQSQFDPAQTLWGVQTRQTAGLVPVQAPTKTETPTKEKTRAQTFIEALLPSKTPPTPTLPIGQITGVPSQVSKIGAITEIPSQLPVKTETEALVEIPTETKTQTQITVQTPTDVLAQYTTLTPTTTTTTTTTPTPTPNGIPPYFGSLPRGRRGRGRGLFGPYGWTVVNPIWTPSLAVKGYEGKKVNGNKIGNLIGIGRSGQKDISQFI